MSNFVDSYLYDVDLKTVLTLPTGDVVIPTVACDISFELNAIPSATVMVAVGRDAYSWAPSAIHLDAVAQALRVGEVPAQLRATVTPRVGGVPGPGFGFPVGEFTLFEGFTGPSGPSMGVDQAGFELRIDHWLCKLRKTSVLSRMSHPSNPGDFTFGALCQSGATGARAFVGACLPASLITDFNAASDLWGNLFLPWLQELASKDQAMIRAFTNLTADAGANREALDALARMAPAAGEKPLALRLAADGHLPKAIANSISALLANPAVLAAQTAWDLIVANLAPTYLFSVVPRISSTQVVPLIAGVRDPGVEVAASEVHGFHWISGTTPGLKAIVLMAAGGSITNFEDPAAPRPLDAYGYYSPTGATGMIKVRRCPDWLTTRDLFIAQSGAAAGVVGQPIPDAAQPGNGPPAAPAVPDRGSFLTAYAKTLFLLDYLKDRNAVFQGPFRLDIAPGTTVRLDPQGQQAFFAAGSDGLAAPVYGTVLHVSCKLDCRNGQAGTAFHMTHTRTDAENSETADPAAERFSTKDHPLYASTFHGAGLT